MARLYCYAAAALFEDTPMLTANVWAVLELHRAARLAAFDRLDVVLVSIMVNGVMLGFKAAQAGGICTGIECYRRQIEGR